MYETSWVPEHLPGGGGFSVKNFSLTALYDDHKHVKNYWTKGNVNLPLLRYTGCKMKLYQSEDTDYVFGYKNCGALTSSLLQYNGLQPSVFMMNKHTIKVPSKQTQKRKKPYITVKIDPPSIMQNKWYFAADITNIPLLQTQAVAASFDHYYISPWNMSTNITIHSLNTSLIQNRDFKNWTTGYYCQTIGTQKIYLYASHEESEPSKIKSETLIYLGNTKYNTPGVSKRDSHDAEYKASKNQYWGNPFHTDYLNESVKVYQSPINFATQLSSTTAQQLTEITGLVRSLRYNPYKDDGSHNQCYFLSNMQAAHGWPDPGKEELIGQGFPLYILMFGFEDYIKKLKILLRIDEDYMLVIRTNTTTPTQDIIVPIDYDFIIGHSPFEDRANPIDNDRWYPQTQYQQKSINDIISCGPGIARIEPKKTVEAKALYTFYFKFGGCPAPMSIVENPTDQPKFPVPSNLYETNSLQSPALPITDFLYNFDERQGLLTEKAAKRIKKHQQIEKLLFTDGATESPFSAPAVHQETSEESSEEEKEEASLLEQLNQQYTKQQQLRQRILRTLHHLQKLE